MKIHTVRAPFYCRVGQFEEGKRSLCFGLQYTSLINNKEFWCYIGKNKETHYEIDSAEALKIGQKWTNHWGRTVIIIPLLHFKKVTVNPKVDEAKELKREKSIDQASLL